MKNLPPKNIIKSNLTPAVCKHDIGFHCQDPHCDGNNVFACNMGCGFFLNFDPEKYPNGIAFKPLD